MKRSSSLLMLLSLAAPVLAAVEVNNTTLTHARQDMNIDMTINLADLKVPSNQAVVFTPVFSNGSDSLCLPSIGVYGRRRYYTYVRQGRQLAPTAFRSGDCPASFTYKEKLVYEPWMNGATLSLRRTDYGCCNKEASQSSQAVGQFEEFIPWVPGQAFISTNVSNAKTRSIQGQAFIDFPVNKTDIRPDYRRNSFELAKIRATIDSVRSDKDITITQVWLKGYASPEGSYSHNSELASGRTRALSGYVESLYQFPDGVIVTDYEPEDWAGLRKQVEQMALPHQTQILEIIDSSLQPDAKDARIKKLYPQEYLTLLREVYPALRHTDYRVAYQIKEYTNPREIASVMETAPQNLSLDEFYLLSQQYKPESPEYARVIQTAAAMYPTDATANLNAANVALRAENFDLAARYLEKAGSTPEAEYARGALAYMRGNKAAARAFFEKARPLQQAKDALEKM